MQIELNINNDERVLPSVRALLQQALSQVSLADSSAGELQQLVMLAVEDTVKNAYPIGEEGFVKLAICEKDGKLELRIRDFGLPQDVARLEQQLHNPSSTIDVLHGGHVTDVADDVHWQGFGREGKSLHIVKWLHASHISQSLPNDEPQRSAEEVTPAPEQQYTIRRMLPE